MTTPPEPPAPPTPDPAPPAPPPTPDPPAPKDEAAELRAALKEEREERKRLAATIAKLEQGQMSDAEKAIAEAKEAGRAEARQEAALEVAAATFRELAAGKLVNARAALKVIDLKKLLDRDGKPDEKKIAALVEELAAVPPAPPPGGHVPTGPRAPAVDGTGDFIRMIGRR